MTCALGIRFDLNFSLTDHLKNYNCEWRSVKSSLTFFFFFFLGLHPVWFWDQKSAISSLALRLNFLFIYFFFSNRCLWNNCVFLTVLCGVQWNINCFILIHSATIRPLKMKIMSFEMFLFAYIISSCDKWVLQVNKLYSYIYTKCLGYSKDIH